MFETLVIGNVGSCKFTKAGETSVLNISLASSRRIGEKQFTDWVSAKVWGERAEKLKEHIVKGMKLLVRGRAEARGYKRADGTMAGELILHVNDLEFLTPKKAEEATDEATEAGDDPPAADAGAGRSQRRRR